MTQFCIEEASLIALEAQQSAALEELHKQNEPEPRPGEITDPVMQNAMAEAKRLHAEQFGVRT